MKKITIKNMTITALMSAFLCVISPFTIPIGIIPLSLASFAIMLIPLLLGAKRGTLSIILYIIIGAFGLPVFSGFGSGLGKILGPTGGYIIGYIFCGMIVGLAADRRSDKLWVYPAAMITGTAVLYAFGTAWYVIQSGNPLSAAIAACVIPFIPGDIIKIAAATAVGCPLRRTLTKHNLI